MGWKGTYSLQSPKPPVPLKRVYRYNIETQDLKLFMVKKIVVVERYR